MPSAPPGSGAGDLLSRLRRERELLDEGRWEEAAAAREATELHGAAAAALTAGERDAVLAELAACAEAAGRLRDQAAAELAALDGARSALAALRGSRGASAYVNRTA